MEESEKFWNRVSKAAGNKLSQQASKTIEHAKVFLKPDDVVLDFGCGPGTITNIIAQNVKSVCAIDLSSGMIDMARKKTEDTGIENVDYVRSTIFDESLKEGTFDVVLAFNVLHYIQNISEVTQRINALLKPEGLFISATACLKERASVARALMFTLSRTGLVPETIFYKTSGLEYAISQGSFDVLKTERISNLPEYFIAAKKKRNY